MIIEEEEVEPPPKKQRLPPLDPLSSYSLTHLPNEIIVNCIAPISKSYYPSLSLVSKTFRSLISSPDLYTERSQIGTTELSLYISLKFHYTEPSPRWYSLWVKPNGSLTDGRIREKSSGNLFVPITNHSPSCSKTTVTIGSEIYSFGGPTDNNNQHSSAVWVYDCRNNTSRNLPNMKMERRYASACFLNDKIYVMGGCSAWFEHEIWFEMFDLKTQTWETLPANPERDVRLRFTIRKIFVVKGKIYLKTHECNQDWIYDIEERKWSVADRHLSLQWSNSWCVIENVIYSYSFSLSRVVCYDLGSGTWREVKGLEVLRKYRCLSSSYPQCMVELVNFNGKLAILWDRFERPGRSQNKNIWCAMVSLERWGGGKMKGNIEWVDVVLTVPRSYDFLHCLAVSV